LPFSVMKGKSKRKKKKRGNRDSLSGGEGGVRLTSQTKKTKTRPKRKGAFYREGEKTSPSFHMYGKSKHQKREG